MATTRQELKDYCLRRLGWPVIEINVDDDQVEDRIDDALHYFSDHHYNGTERVFHAQQVTQADIDNMFITIPNEIIYVTRVLPIGGAAGGLFNPMGDPSLAWNSTSANPLFGAGGGAPGANHAVRTTQDHAGGAGGMDKFSFYLQMSSIEEFNQMFSNIGGEMPIRYSKHTDKVYIDHNWNELLSVDDYVIVEGWAALDPDVYTQVWNDQWIKKYLTMQLAHELPVDFYMG